MTFGYPSVRRSWVVWLCFIGMLTVSSLAQTASSGSTLIVRARTLFDSVAGRMVDHPVIVIKGDRIESVSTGTPSNIAGATMVDLGDATLLPGFIDVHTHLTSNAGS